MINCNNMLRLTTIIFVFFPFIGFIPNIDTQPFFIFVLSVQFLAVILLYNEKIRLEYTFVFLYIYMLIIFLLSSIINGEVGFIVKELFTIISIFLLYSLIFSGHLSISTKIIILVILTYSIVGFVQMFFPNFMTGLVSRTTDHIELLVESGRGVRSLTGEPAQFGKILILLNVLLLYSMSIENNSHNITKSGVLVTVILFLLNVILSASAYSVAFHLLLLFPMLLIYNTKIFVVFIACFAVALVWYLDAFSGNRISFILMTLYQTPELIMAQGAFSRLMNIPLSIVGIQNFGLIGAMGTEQTIVSSIQTPIGEYHYTATSKLFGGIIQYVLSYGLLSIPILIYFLFISLRYSSSFYFFILSCYLTLIVFQDGALTNPIQWFTIFWAAKCSRFLYEYNKSS